MSKMFVVASNIEIKEESEKWIAVKKIGSQYTRKEIKIQMNPKVNPHPEGGNPSPGRENSIQDADGLDPIPKEGTVFTWGGAKWIYLAKGTDIQEKNEVVDLFASFVADRKGRKGGPQFLEAIKGGPRFLGEWGRGGPSIPRGNQGGPSIPRGGGGALKLNIGDYP